LLKQRNNTLKKEKNTEAMYIDHYKNSTVVDYA